MRLTQKVLEQLLRQNEGFSWETYFEGRNFRESRVYEIVNGVLTIHSRGKSSWADSRFDEKYLADPGQTRRAIRSVLDRLNTDGLN